MGRLSIDLLSMSHEIGVADAEDSISVIHFNIKLRSQAEHVNEPSSFSLLPCGFGKLQGSLFPKNYAKICFIKVYFLFLSY